MVRVILWRKGDRFVAANVSDPYSNALGSEAAGAARHISAELSKGPYETPDSAKNVASGILGINYGVHEDQIEFLYRRL